MVVAHFTLQKLWLENASGRPQIAADRRSGVCRRAISAVKKCSNLDWADAVAQNAL